MPAPGDASLDWTRVAGAGIDAPPSPPRALDTYPPPPAPIPAQVRLEPEDYAGPIRVRVPSGGPIVRGDDDPGDATPPPPARSDEPLVPDQHQPRWALDEIRSLLSEARDSVSWIRPLQDYVAKGVEVLERIDGRIAPRLREDAERQRAEQAAVLARPRVLRLLDHPAVKPGLSLLTWLWGGLSGALLVGVLDYLGAETEPVTRFLLGWLGVLF